MDFRSTIRSILYPMESPRRPPRKLEGEDHWEDVGHNQYEYLLKNGLKPEHYLLDLPCGSFRGGRFFIDSLHESHYFGCDRDQESINAGIEQVLQPQGLLKKKPRIEVVDLSTESKDFSQIFGFKRFDFVWIHALFDHIPHDVIQRCLADISEVTAPGGKIYATIFLNPHGPGFLEPMVRPRNGTLERAVVTFPDREYWHHTREFFDETVQKIPTLLLEDCLFDYPHPLGLRMLKFSRK